MLLRMRTPLAWKNLTHDVRRLLLATGGIAFAVLLMCMQLSFQDALFDSTLALVRMLNADLVITSRAKYTVIVRETFSRRRLAQALQAPGVAWVQPLYVETQFSMLRNFASPDAGEPIRVLGCEPDPLQPALRLGPHAHVLWLRLRQAGTALYDTRSKVEAFGRLAAGQQVELAGQTIRLVGTFDLGTDFANDGNLIVGSETYRRLFGSTAPAQDALAAVDIGLVKLKRGADPRAVQATLRQMLPDDVKVLTIAEFERQELRFWQRSTPIGYVFHAGVLLGFLVGVIICYQILYSDIADHMPEFATLKAMGYRAEYFIGVVLQEAGLLSLFGFWPGIAGSWLLCRLVAWRTGLPVGLSFVLLLEVFVLTVAMCVLSGVLTMRKVLASDPAELF